ncbi:MAG: nuclear transport factor 2 family protein [Pseudomonadota bacterium]
MHGFSNKFKDFPDYILGITQEIWEERGLGLKMRDYYHKDVVIRTPAGIAFGEPGMTAATMATLVEFPDRALLGEDVIWSGTPDEGMLSSHRIYTTGTHLGDGLFGKATGKRFGIHVIADCYAHANQISDEWLIRDNGGIVRQLGMEPRDWAQAQIDAGDDNMPFTPAVDQDGPYLGRGNDNAWGQKLADLLTRIMNAELSVIPAEWDRAAVLSYAGAVQGHSWGDADRFWLTLRSAFPSAEFKIHHVIGRDDPLMPPRAAVRWSLTGKHDGHGVFGPPTGAEVHVMGATHAEFGPWGLRREVSLYDETAVWKQILLQKG